MLVILKTMFYEYNDNTKYKHTKLNNIIREVKESNASEDIGRFAHAFSDLMSGGDIVLSSSQPLIFMLQMVITPYPGLVIILPHKSTENYINEFIVHKVKYDSINRLLICEYPLIIQGVEGKSAEMKLQEAYQGYRDNSWMTLAEWNELTKKEDTKKDTI